MKIFINLFAFYNHIKVEADVDKNNVIINNVQTSVNALEFAKKLLNIVANWEENYNANLIDGDRFLIEIQEGDLKKIYRGQGKYPLNYNEFKRLLGEISGAKL